MRLWLGVGGVAVAAVAATGAFGVTGGDTITTIAGTGVAGFSGDGGPATSAQLHFPYAVAVDGKGNVYIVDNRNSRVRKVSPGGTITTIAGGGRLVPGDGGPATSAQLFYVVGVAVDGQGNVYIADLPRGRVRKVSPSGTITTFAGGGSALGPGWGDGGPATSAQLNGGPTAVAVDGQGNVYIAEDHRVRKVNPSGTITTIAGTTTRGFSGDGGPATSAKLFNPEGVAVDAQGNVYIADATNNRVRKVSTGGTITTIAGNGQAGFSGDGGPATSARLGPIAGGVPQGLVVDTQGNLYIADTQNNRVRSVSPGGTITTIAGNGQAGFSGDGGPAARAQLHWPAGLAVDSNGSLYIVDYGNNRVRKVGKSGTASAKFYSPSRNLSCGMADGPGRSVRVKCQSRKLPHSVSMGLDGRLKICRGTHCLGNPGVNTPTLGYGRQITVGRFRCRSQRSGVRCTVIRSGKGFLIDSKVVRRVGP